MQQISNKYNTTVIRLFEIAGHGKGELDHVGGIAKVAVRQEITKGAVFSNSSEITTFLQDKFRDKEFPKYHITEITNEDIESARDPSRQKVFPTIDGSSFFQVIVFKPSKGSNNYVIKASTCLCMCEKCMLEYGLCELFAEYELRIQHLTIKNLRSDLPHHLMLLAKKKQMILLYLRQWLQLHLTLNQ